MADTFTPNPASKFPVHSRTSPASSAATQQLWNVLSKLQIGKNPENNTLVIIQPGGTDGNDSGGTIPATTDLLIDIGVNVQTGNYTLQESDHAKNVILTQITPNPVLTIPSVFPLGFWCYLTYMPEEGFGNKAVLSAPDPIKLDGILGGYSIMANQGIFLVSDGTQYWSNGWRNANFLTSAASGQFLGTGVAISITGLLFTDATTYQVAVSYDYPTVNPGILSVEYVDGANIKVHSSSATDGSNFRIIAYGT
jgi:hypothetical protein